MSKPRSIKEALTKTSTKSRIRDYTWMHEIGTCWWNWEFVAMCKKIERYERYYRVWFARELLEYIATLEIKNKHIEEFIYNDITEMYADWYYNKIMYTSMYKNIY